ncbi:MAG: ABC transporter permease [Ruminococcus sp.]|nr:ABC transporter permease [Ruminococcus sp.]
MTEERKHRFKEGSFLELLNYKDLLYQLVARDIKLKYRRSFLGYVWSVLNPLLIMIIMSIVFTMLFTKKTELFPIYLMCGRTVFEFIKTATDKALGAVTDNASLLKKTYVSKFMFPMSKITASMVDFVFSLGALVLLIIYYSFKYSRSLFSFWDLGIVIVIVEAYIFAMGLGFLLAALNVFFRDIKYIYHAITTMWIYCSAIFYNMGSFYDKGAKQIKAGHTPYALYLAKIIEYLNPAYIYIKQFRAFVWVPICGRKLESWAFVDAKDFVLGFAYAFLMFTIGVAVFRKSQDKFILYI